jgi:hypothetical protein
MKMGLNNGVGRTFLNFFFLFLLFLKSTILLVSCPKLVDLCGEALKGVSGLASRTGRSLASGRIELTIK